MGCSICGAEGVTKTTCPFNPSASNPKPTKHNRVPRGADSGPSGAGAGAGAGAMTAQPKPKLKAKIKKPSSASASASAASAAGATGFNMKQLQQEAEALFPHDPKTQADYMSDYMGVAMPRVPRDDVVSRAHEEVQRALQQKRAAMAKNCAQCVKGVKLNKMIKDPAHWLNLSRICDACQRDIGELYHDKNFKEEYKSYHRGNLPVDQLVAHGSKSGYYNGTMYTGAKYWTDIAARRAGQAMPKPPSSPPSRF